jgi:hypothetical protein
MLINRASVAETVDAINAARFDGRTLAVVERRQAAPWIAGRQVARGLRRHVRRLPFRTLRGALSCLLVSASRRHLHATSWARKPRGCRGNYACGISR